MEEWTPWQSWWLDLLKSAITFTIGAVVTLSVIDRVQAARARERSRADALFQLQLSAIREFDRTVSTYEVAAHTAYTDLYQWHGGPKTDAMQHYEGTAFGEYLAVVSEIKRWFSGSASASSAIEALEEAHRQRHALYDHWVDLMLDSGSKASIHPAKDRAEFNRVLSQARAIRSSLVAELENALLLREL